MTWTYSLHVEVDWAGLGWDDASDLKVDLVSATCTRGFSGDAKDGFVAPAGEASIDLLNNAGQYSRNNLTGPYYGNLTGGKPIRLRLSSPVNRVIWTGLTDRVRISAPIGDQPTATITAKGQFIRLSGDQKVTPTSSPGETSDIPLATLFEAAGFAPEELDFETGEVTMGVWDPGEVKAYDEARAVVATELGRLYERRDGTVVFESRHHRRDTARSNTVQLNWSDDPADAETAFGYREPDLSDPEDQIYDRIKVDFTPVFTLSDEPVRLIEWLGSYFGLSVPPGSTRAFVLDPFYFTPTAGYFLVDPITPTLNAGNLTSTIEIASGFGNADVADLTLSNVVLTSTKLSFILANGSDLPANIAYVLLWGKKGLVGAPVRQVVGAGLREYPLPGTYYPSAGEAMTAARYLYNYFSLSRDLLTMETTALESEALFTALLDVEIGDRHHVKATGLTTEFATDADFFVERETWVFDKDREVSYQALFSACLPNLHDTEGESTLPAGSGIYYPMEQASGLVRDILATEYHLTRHGTSAAVGIVGRGQQFVASEGDSLVNTDSGLPDAGLTGSWELNGWVIAGAPPVFGGDQIIYQKDLGDTPAYRLYEYALDATHYYFQADITTEDGVFTCPSDGNLIVPGTSYFVRLVHDAVNKLFGYAVGSGTVLRPLQLIPYTGTPLSSGPGIVFGGTGPSGTLVFDEWYNADDLTGTLSDDDTVTTLPDLSGNARDATAGGGGGSVTFQTGELSGHPIVRFGPGHLAIPELGLSNAQIFVKAKTTSYLFDGIILRTSSGAGPNYVLGFSSFDNRILVHAYSDNNNNSYKRQSTVGHALPDGWTVYRVEADYSGPSLALWVDGASTPLEVNTNNISGASGIDGDNLVTVDIYEIVIAHDLTEDQSEAIEAAMIAGTPVADVGSSGGSKSLNAILDEWLYVDDRFLSEPEAEERFNGGAGNTATGGEGSSSVPTPSTIHGPNPAGPIADRPQAAPVDSLYFATDVNDGTLYQWDGTDWQQVSPGLSEISDAIAAHEAAVDPHPQYNTEAEVEAFVSSLFTAKGQLLVGTGPGTYAILDVGAPGTIPFADPSTLTGIRWDLLTERIVSPPPIVIHATLPAPVVRLDLVVTPPPILVEVSMPAPVIATDLVVFPPPIEVLATLPAPTAATELAVSPPPIVVLVTLPAPTVDPGTPPHEGMFEEILGGWNL